MQATDGLYRHQQENNKRTKYLNHIVYLPAREGRSKLNEDSLPHQQTNMNCESRPHNEAFVDSLRSFSGFTLNETNLIGSSINKPTVLQDTCKGVLDSKIRRNVTLSPTQAAPAGNTFSTYIWFCMLRTSSRYVNINLYCPWTRPAHFHSCHLVFAASPPTQYFHNASYFRTLIFRHYLHSSITLDNPFFNSPY